MFKGLIIGFWMSRVEKALNHFLGRDIVLAGSEQGAIRIKPGESTEGQWSAVWVYLDGKPVCELALITQRFGGYRYEFRRFNYGIWAHTLYKAYKQDVQQLKVSEKIKKSALFEPLDE